MSVQQRIKEIFLRNARAVALRPSVGQGTAVTRVRLREGLICDVEEGPWKLTVDMTVKSGGDEAGPNPGVYGRTALGSCMAITYAQGAALRGIHLRSLEVEIQADYDSRPELGVDGAESGYVQVRCVVKVDTDAPEEAVIEMLDDADQRSSYLAVFRRPQDVRREVRFVGRER